MKKQNKTPPAPAPAPPPPPKPAAPPPQAPGPLALRDSEVLLGWLYLSMEFLVLPTIIYTIGDFFGGFSTTTANIVYYITNAVACCLIFRKALHTSLANAGRHTGDFIIAVVMGFLAYYASGMLIDKVIGMIWPTFSNVNDQAISAMLAEQPDLMAICVVALVPIAEECMFRGLLFRPYLKIHPGLAYAISSLSFAAVHVIGYLGSADPITLVICFLQYLPAGISLAWACHKADSLFAPILIHAAINGLSVYLAR